MREPPREPATGLLVLLGLVLSALPVAAQSAQTDTIRLDLAGAARMAAERSAGVALEDLAVAEAEAKVEEDRASLLPHLSFDASHGRRTFNTASFGIEFPTPAGGIPLFDPNGEVIGPVTTVDVRGRFTQTLLDWSAIERLRGSRLSRDASITRTAAARERAAAGAAVAYVQTLRATGRLQAREADLALAEELMAGARELLASGVGVRLDVTRAEAQLATVRSEIVTARSSADRALLALRRALGLPLDVPLALGDLVLPANEPGPVDPEVEVAVALEQRPDLHELEGWIDASRQDVAMVHAERFPTLTFAVGDGVTGKQYEHLLNTYEWSLHVSIPVFDGMRRSAREEEERAQVTALETRLRDLSDQIAFEVRDAIVQLGAARELIEASGARLTFAEAELDQAQERFQAGVAGIPDVLLASIRLGEARAADVDARAAYQGARIALAAAQGSVQDLR